MTLVSKTMGGPSYLSERSWEDHVICMEDYGRTIATNTTIVGDCKTVEGPQHSHICMLYMICGILWELIKLRA